MVAIADRHRRPDAARARDSDHVVDTGLDFSHPEFAGRPDLSALNTQEPAGIGGEHGTMVASVIGAPLNGVGIVGIYPRAVLRSWDIAKGAGRELDSTEISGGILAAARLARRHQPQRRRDA